MEINPQIGEKSTSQSEHTLQTEPAETLQSEPIEALQPEPAASTSQDEPQIMGLSEEETRDPNEISITIADKANPIVVLFGPPACGKTMTLVRLTRYLRTLGLKVEPIASFRPSADTHYAKMCHDFPSMIGSSEAANSTKNISFMMVRVIDEVGRVLCQILEAPGEYYYNPNDESEPNVDFPRYVNAIKNSSNRKIWCYMVEPQWKFSDQAHNYVAKIHKLKRNMRPQDKAVFIFNKIDLTPFVITPGQVNMKSAKKEVEDLYPGIFSLFKSHGIFGDSDNFELVPFHTGDYSKKIAGGYSFEQGPDEYPQKLWQTILKLIRG